MRQNGIVVGPEISRIFAEIILQEVDGAVRRDVRDSWNLTYGKDYEIRRYVDDYFVFANSVDDLDILQSALANCLERYKLYLNDEKTETNRRPFVSKISLARGDVADLISSLHKSLDDLGASDALIAGRKAREVRKHCLSIRLICERHRVPMSSISGWLMSQLRVLLRRSIGAMHRSGTESLADILEDISSAIMSSVFYVCALDLRVRSTYSLCQVLAGIDELKGEKVARRRDRLLHQAESELDALIELAEGVDGKESIELYNLLIAGAHFIGPRFLSAPSVTSSIDRIMNSGRISYFQYITLKFVLLKSTGHLQLLSRLNDIVRGDIIAKAKGANRESETFLLACDYLSAPDVHPNSKRPVLQALVGGDYTNASISEISRYVGFTDWAGLRIQHLLARKELRPVYAWV